MALINNENSNSFRRSDRRGSEKNSSQFKSKNQPNETVYSSDLELELPAHFGRQSNSIEQIEKDLDDIDKESCRESLAMDTGISSEKQVISHDETKEIITDPKPPANHNNAEMDPPESGEQNLKEIPKKRYNLFHMKR
jgi:hypothetical protein